MPNLTLFIPAETMPCAANLASLTERCTELCTGILQAVLENVHIIYVAVHHGRGHPAYVEVKYRLEPNRTRSAMDAFMAGLDEAITRYTGLTARIRCFGHAAATLHARN